MANGKKLTRPHWALVVEATLEYLPNGPSSRPARPWHLEAAGSVTNHGESGPGFGIGFVTGRHRLASADGAWLPGTYRFSTTAIVAAPDGTTPDVALHTVARLNAAFGPC